MTAIDMANDVAKGTEPLGLPPLTTDLEEAKAHLDEFGVARIADALSAEERTALTERLVDQARAERELGLAFMDGGGSNQRVWNLPSKGRVFLDLLTTPIVRTLARHILQGDYLLSSHTANITGPGGVAMPLHTDQGFAPRSIDMALTMNVMWMLNEFTDEIGATRLVPGSHRVQAEPPRSGATTVAGVGPAGTALVFDGRIWHGTGANTTSDQYRYGVLTYFVRPFVRQQENYVLSTDPAVVAGADDELANLLGLRTWRTLGGVQGPWGPGTPTKEQSFGGSARVGRDNVLIGQLHPSS